MRKHTKRLLLLIIPALALAGCTEDFGTEPGNDNAPAVSVFTYNTAAPNDPDVDATYRVAVNNKTDKLYYLAEPATSTAESDGIVAQRVVSQGTEVVLGTDSVTGGRVADVVVKNMVGEYNVHFVAAKGNQLTLNTQSFTGLEWVDAATGTYYFSARGQAYLGMPASKAATLQYLKTAPTQYRFKNLYGIGYSLVLNKTSESGADDYDTFDFYRVPSQQTPASYGSYGTISVRDIGYWQNDDSYAFSEGYGCYVYNNALKHSAIISIQYFVSAGSLGNAWDQFVADK